MNRLWHCSTAACTAVVCGVRLGGGGRAVARRVFLLIIHPSAFRIIARGEKPGGDPPRGKLRTWSGRKVQP